MSEDTPTEAQPEQAGATVDFTLPFAYSIERRDTEGNYRRLSCGTRTRPWLGIPADETPTLLIAYARANHSWSGPMRLRIWTHRGDDEDLRPPDGCMTLTPEGRDVLLTESEEALMDCVDYQYQPCAKPSCGVQRAEHKTTGSHRFWEWPK